MHKIGILTERMLLGYGVDLVADMQAQHLAKKRYDVGVYTCRKDSLYDAVPYRVIDLRGEIKSAERPFGMPFRKEATQWLERQNRDVWIAHSPPFNMWRRALSKPVIFWEHGTPPGKWFDERPGFELDWLTYYRTAHVYGKSGEYDRTVAISDFIRQSFPEKVQGETEVVHNGADHYKRVSEEEARDLRKKLGIAEDRTAVLFVGRLEWDPDPQPYKGLRQLTDEIAPALSSMPDIELIAAGRGDETKMEHLRRKNILPLANVEKEVMPVLYKAADVFISPSRWEGFNLPLLEAQHQGTPIIAYGTAVHREVIRSGGILADDFDSFIQAVKDLSRDRGKRENLGREAVKNSGRFSWQRHGEKMEDVIKSCLEACADKTMPVIPPEREKLIYYALFMRYILKHKKGRYLLSRLFGK